VTVCYYGKSVSNIVIIQNKETLRVLGIVQIILLPELAWRRWWILECARHFFPVIYFSAIYSNTYFKSINVEHIGCDTKWIAISHSFIIRSFRNECMGAFLDDPFIIERWNTNYDASFVSRNGCWTLTIAKHNKSLQWLPLYMYTLSQT